jgi:hypothetical protein
VQEFTSKQYRATFNAYVAHDSIYGPGLGVTWLLPQETINQITSATSTDKLKLFLGFHFGGGTAQFNLGPQAWLLTKTDQLYGISTDLAQKQPNAQLYIGWKLHL